MKDVSYAMMKVLVNNESGSVKNMNIEQCMWVDKLLGLISRCDMQIRLIDGVNIEIVKNRFIKWIHNGIYKNI